MQDEAYAPSRSPRDLTTGLSDHERESRSSIEADADCDDRWNGRGEGGDGEGPRSIGGSPDTEPPRMRELVLVACPWNSDMNMNRLRGDSAPSGIGLGGLDDAKADGLPVPALDGLDGLAAPDLPGIISVGERAGDRAGEAGNGMLAAVASRSGVLIVIAAS